MKTPHGLPFSATPLMPTVPTRPGWRWRLLTDIARLATGHTPSRREPAWWGGDIPWLQLPDIRALDGRRAFTTLEQTNALGIENSSSVVLPKGTVCMSRTAQVGFVTIMGCEMATSQDFVNWVCGPDLDPEFLMHLLIASRKAIRDLGSGATHQSIYFHTVRAFCVCVPPITDQRRIAARLNEQLTAVERARAAAQSRLAAAESLPAACLAETWDAAGRTAGGLTRLGDLAASEDAFTDGPFGSNLKTDHYVRHGARVVRLQNIGRGVFLGNDRSFVSFDHFATLTRHHVREGDIVFAALGDGRRPAGRSCVVPEGFGPGLVKADCFRVRLPSGTIDPCYAIGMLNSPQSLRAVAATMRGATRPRVTLEVVRSLSIPVPPIDDQHSIAANLSRRLAKAERLTETIRGELATIESLPAALQREVFQGND